MGDPTTLEYVSKIRAVVKVTDGDTYWFKVALPFRLEATICCRLIGPQFGYDCPERTKGSAHERAEARRAATVASSFVIGALADPAVTLWVRTERDPDDFGRWLGDVWREDADGTKRHLGPELRSLGLASIWPTRWRDEFDT
jgi:endonuclease YncB( thermonuclease family)